MDFVVFLLHLQKSSVMDRLIRRCIVDMEAVAASGKYTLDAQTRAYDLLEMLIDVYGDGQSSLPKPPSSSEFCSAYDRLADALESGFDAEFLRKHAALRLEPLKKDLQDARFAAATAASLHEFAKETFEVWKTAGVFARRRALRELRERAGFRLESHRIGNYVAKTFDLMNEADARFAKIQQRLFAADVTYKIKPGVYAGIAGVLA